MFVGPGDLKTRDRVNLSLPTLCPDRSRFARNLSAVLAVGALALAPQGECRRYSVEKIDDHTAPVSGDLTLLAITKPLTVNVSLRRRRPMP
jgi:hypothetical protein